jgi:hypothetical protein
MCKSLLLLALLGICGSEADLLAFPYLNVCEELPGPVRAIDQFEGTASNSCYGASKNVCE